MKGKGNQAVRKNSTEILWYIPLIIFVVGIFVMNFN